MKMNIGFVLVISIYVIGCIFLVFALSFFNNDWDEGGKDSLAVVLWPVILVFYFLVFIVMSPVWLGKALRRQYDRWIGMND